MPSREWTAWNFYQYAYTEQALQLDDIGAQVTSEQFLRRLTENIQQEPRNTLFFLQGDVGVGKTAYINFLISKYGRQLFMNKRSWFIRYNVELQRKLDERLELRDVFRGLITKAAKVIDRIALHHGKQTSNIMTELQGLAVNLRSLPDEATLDDCKECFARAVNSVSRLLNRRLLLALDNLDSYFHQDERYQFLPGARFADRSSISSMLELVASFHNANGPTARLSASVLFVVRPESYRVLESSTDYSRGLEEAFSDRKNLYTLLPPDATLVVQRRIKLLKLVLAKVLPAAQRVASEKALERVVRSITAHIEPSRSRRSRSRTLDALVAISNQGLRDVLDFFREHIFITNWIEGVQEDLELQRYLDYKPIGLMAFMMNGKCKFSQAISHFPNVFLVNIEALDQASIGYRDEDDTPRALEVAHKHSYWLKYLIIQYLAIVGDANRAIKEEELIEVFAGKPKIDGFYDENAVRLALGSLSERNGSNLLTVERSVLSGGRIVKTNIGLNSRGKYCLSDIFFRFFYLQLVVDDWALALPPSLAQGKDSVNYSYLTLPDPKYHEFANRMVELKADAVSGFLGLLKAALEKEKLIFFEAFSRLSSVGLPLPDVDSIFQTTLEEISLVSRQVSAFSGIRSIDDARLRAKFEEHYSLGKSIMQRIY